MLNPARSACLLSLALLSAWVVGILGRGYWTPDEPREADIAWRMSWQTDKAVPLLAGEPFCEKPPFTYWVAGAAMRELGVSAWTARLPNLLYALIGALGVGWLARRAAGPVAGWAAALALGTFLLSYQVAIWLATDAPLLAAVSVALAGAYRGFYAVRRGERLGGYTLMHGALAVGFLCKSGAAWMVPALALGTLIVWERRWRELVRWELYAGLVLQAAVISAWVWRVYAGPDGVQHLKVFFWNNLAGRFAEIDAPRDLQYAGGHRNSPGKYLLELPTYLWPWTLLVLAAARRAWLERRAPREEQRPVRFALACTVPTLVLLSLAATARNIYLAPAMPGFALLVGWWIERTRAGHDAWDLRAVRATALLLILASAVFAAALALVGLDDALRAGVSAGFLAGFAAPGALGVLGCAALAAAAERAARRGGLLRGAIFSVLAYGMLLSVAAWPLYHEVDAWQDLPSIGRGLRADAAGRPLILMAPDETTRAFIDMFTRAQVATIEGPIDAGAIDRLRRLMAREPRAWVVAQWPGRQATPTFLRVARALGINPDGAAAAPEWMVRAGLSVVRMYALPNGRRYAVLGRAGAAAVARNTST